LSFLDQLKSKASALQSEQIVQQSLSAADIKATEAAARTSWFYIADLARQLDVIEPDGPALSLDNKTHWPAMKLCGFRADSRKKKLNDAEVFDYIALAWRIVPRHGAPLPGSVSANFPPDLERIEKRIAAGSVQHERVNVRHPQKGTLQAIQFNYATEAKGSVTITVDHLNAKLQFRLATTSGFAIDNTTYAASQVQSAVLDELAKLIVGQANRFA
jgi:hypothetical protein